MKALSIATLLMASTVVVAWGEPLRSERVVPCETSALANASCVAAPTVVSSEPIVDPTELAATELVARLQGTSTDYLPMGALLAQAGASATEVTEDTDALTLLCGTGWGAYTAHTSYPPVCGKTPAEAQANAIAEVTRQLKQGFECEKCPFTSQCKLDVSTLPSGWFVSVPVFNTITLDAPMPLCPGKYSAYASYSGAYLVFCTPCDPQ